MSEAGKTRRAIVERVLASMAKRSPRAFNPTFLIIGKLEKVSDGTCGLSASFGNIAA